MNQSFFKVVLSHAPKYLTGSVIAAVATLLMTKYYTAVFTPAEFGILALYLLMFKYITTLVSLNMDSGSTRFYFDYRESRRDEYLSTIFWFITATAIVVLLAGLLLMPSVSEWIAPGSGTVYIVTLLTGIGAVYVSFLTRVLYNEHRSSSVLKHSVLQTFVNHFSSFVLISFFNLGIFGRMGGQGLGYITNVVTLIREFSKENLFRLQRVFNKAMAKETFMLALPSIIAALMTVGFFYIDRIFIKHFSGDHAVGVYTLGFMLGQGLGMVYEAVAQAILPKVYSDMNHDYEKAKVELERFSYRYYAGLIILTVMISFASPLLVALFSNDNYSDAAGVMPFVMAGFMMGGFYKIPSLVLGYHKVVWFYPLLAFVSFGTNALLNWFFIPMYGIVGAALASFIGVFIYSSVMQSIAKKYMSFKYNLGVLLLYSMIFTCVLGMFYG